MNKVLLLGVVCVFGVSAQIVSAAEQTVRIYPTDDGVNLLYDTDEQTDWSSARLYSEPLTRPTILDSEALVVRSDDQAGYFRIYRDSILFDTSYIPDNAVIQSAALNFYKFPTANNHGDTKIVVTAHYRDTISVLTQSDWSLSHYGSEFSRGLLIDSQYTTFQLNAEGANYINKQSYSVFGMLTEFDFDNIVPTAPSRDAAFYASDAQGTSTDPYLEITYTVPDVVKTPAELLADFATVVQHDIQKKSVQLEYLVRIKILEKLLLYTSTKTVLAYIATIERQIAGDQDRQVIAIATADQLHAILVDLKEIVSE